jgi:hypothetical protein
MSPIHIGEDMPSRGEAVWYYPGPDKNAVGQFGPLIRVIPTEGPMWFACCRAGLGGANSTFELGDSSFISVVEGAGYHIDCNSKDSWSELPLSPAIRAVHKLEAQETVLLFDWLQVAAYADGKQLWITPRLFLDDLEPIEVGPQVVKVRGAACGATAEITLRTTDGSVLDGRSFEW